MENEFSSQQSYYLLGVDIFKNLSLAREHRPIPAKEYLDKCYNEYVKLTENSNAIIKNLEDKLSPLPISIKPTTKQEKKEEDDTEDNVIATLTEEEEFNIAV
jgi:hypothetical protein